MQAEAVFLLPVSFKNDDTAIRALGGPVDVARAVVDAASGKPGVVGLNLRPDDPYCHPIVGSRPQKMFGLFRVRKSRDGSPAAGLQSATGVSVFPAAFVFKGLADFAYLPSRMVTNIDGAYVTAVLQRPQRSPIAVDAAASVPLNLIPGRFCRWDAPKLYEYHSGTKVQRSSQSTVKQAYFDLQDAAEVPSLPQPEPPIKLQPEAVHRIIVLLRELFAVRPIWLFAHLHHYLNVRYCSCVPPGYLRFGPIEKILCFL
jgi:hypothetical protein